MDIATRQIVHWNLTAHPTAAWTAPQFRMIVPGGQPHRFVPHDRDNIYAEGVDRTLVTTGGTVLKTPVRAPQANAFCERLIGTIDHRARVALARSAADEPVPRCNIAQAT
jgi:putative transposase